MPTRTIYLFDDLGNKVAVGTYESAPASLTVGGSWTNTQYTGSAPDQTGLTFTCTFSDGTSSSVVPTSVSPSTWSSTAGTQTATFSYTSGGVTVTGSKSVSVEEDNRVPVTITTSGMTSTSEISDGYKITGAGTYYSGDTVTVTAPETSTAPFMTMGEGFPPEPIVTNETVDFVGWSDRATETSLLSTSTSYTFIATEDIHLTAFYHYR